MIAAGAAAAAAAAVAAFYLTNFPGKFTGIFGCVLFGFACPVVVAVAVAVLVTCLLLLSSWRFVVY